MGKVSNIRRSQVNRASNTTNQKREAELHHKIWKKGGSIAVTLNNNHDFKKTFMLFIQIYDFNKNGEFKLIFYY